MREKVFKSVLLVFIGVVFFGCNSIHHKMYTYAENKIGLEEKNTLTKIQKYFLSHDGKYLVLRSTKGKIQVLNIEKLELKEISFEKKKEKKVISKNEEFIFFDDGNLLIKEEKDPFKFNSLGWSIGFPTNTEQAMATLERSLDEVSRIAMSYASFDCSFYNNLLAISDDGEVKIIDLESKKVLKSISIQDAMPPIIFSLDGKSLLFSKDKNAKAFNLKTEKITDSSYENYQNTFSFYKKKKLKASRNQDGTVSIYSIKTNKKLLTIKLFKNQNRGKSVTILGQKHENLNPDSWLAITPEGYYVGSPDAYKYFDVDKYYEKFYRPEIVKLALQGETIDGLTKISDIKSPPQVEILNGVEETSKESIEIKVAVIAKNGGLGKIQIFRNGSSIAFETRAFQHQQKENFKTYDVPLVKGVNEIKAVAFESTNSASSESNVYTIRSTYQKPHKKSIHALVVGIEKFDNGRFDLKNTVADAKIFKDILNIQKNKGLFHDVNIVLLNTKAKTTKRNILSELKKMRNIHPEDLFVFYVGSHGEINNDGKYYLIPSDIEDDSSESIKKHAISEDDIKEYIGNIPTAQKFIVFDTCKAGSIAGSLSALESTKQTQGVDDKTALNTLSHSVGSGAMIMGASTAKEVANEKYKEHGLFTYVLVEGLRGKAEANGKENIQGSELKDYVYDNVKEISSNLETMPTQTPIINYIGEPFSISGG